MTINRVHLALVLLLAAGVAAACSGSAPTAPSPTAPPTRMPEQDALEVYEQFWTTTTAALAAPGSKDWTSQLQATSTGQALETIKGDVANFASLPAHREGAVTRHPAIDQATNDRVKIVDCVDLGDSRVVMDTTGAVLDDLVHRVQRYRFRAEVINVEGRWLVERTAPALDERC